MCAFLFLDWKYLLNFLLRNTFDTFNDWQSQIPALFDIFSFVPAGWVFICKEVDLQEVAHVCKTLLWLRDFYFSHKMKIKIYHNLRIKMRWEVNKAAYF